MDDLFTLYRYLVRTSNDDDSYALALAALEPVLDLVSSLTSDGRWIRDQGGTEWEYASAMAQTIINAHKAALCKHADGSLEAVVDFAQTHITLKDIDKLIDALQSQKQTLLEFKRIEDEGLGDLDDHPF